MEIQINKKAFIAAIIGFAALLAAYFGILSILNSPLHAIQEFFGMWHWILLLAIGFGTQVGLFVYVREAIKAINAQATGTMVASGGVSTSSMAACCAHHVTDILPILGLSAAAIFLLQYQLFFLLLGVFSNTVGIIMMLGMIKKHGLYNENKGILRAIAQYDLLKVRNGTIAFSAIILIGVFFVLSTQATVNATNATNFSPLATVSTNDSKQLKTINLETKSNNENNVSFDVTPNFSLNDQVSFDVKINTHSVNLDFDMTKISFLEDGKGNLYYPTTWQGSPPGGHHLSGTLIFPKLEEEVNEIKLVIKNVTNIQERIFVWKF